MREFAPCLIAVFVASFLFLPFASAEINWQNNCIDGYYWRNATLCIGSSCSELTQPPVECENGCAANGLICNSAANVPNDYILISALAFLFVSGLVFYLAYRIGSSEGVTKTGEYISFMFVALGIIFIITAMGILGSFFTAEPDSLSQAIGTGYTAFIIVFIIIIAIFIAEYTFGHLKNVKFKKGYR